MKNVLIINQFIYTSVTCDCYYLKKIPLNEKQTKYSTLLQIQSCGITWNMLWKKIIIMDTNKILKNDNIRRWTLEDLLLIIS